MRQVYKYLSLINLILIPVGAGEKSQTPELFSVKSFLDQIADVGKKNVLNCYATQDHIVQSCIFENLETDKIFALFDNVTYE